MNNWLQKKDDKEKEEFPVVDRPKDVTQSGVCPICRERYTDVPVIDGVPACPNCTRLE